MDDTTLFTIPFREAYDTFTAQLNTFCNELEELEDRMIAHPSFNASRRQFLMNLREKGLDGRTTWLVFSLSFKTTEDNHEDIRAIYDKNDVLRKYRSQSHFIEGNRRQQCQLTFLHKLLNRKLLLQEIKDCYLCLGAMMKLLEDEKNIAALHEHFLREIDDWL